ncbi:MAG: hypothetical protein QNJ98_13555 [Planctomycetota bacterium]|nr:hypothetical protein [Planctomycetota bacterium]
MAPATPAKSDRFKPGQVWRYKTRAVEPNARVIIGRVEERPKDGTIIHVKFVGVQVKNNHAPNGVSTELAHAPVALAQVEASVTELTDEAPDLSGFEEGYRTWLAAYKSGEGGVFTVPLSEISEYIEQTLR